MSNISNSISAICSDGLINCRQEASVLVLTLTPCQIFINKPATAALFTMGDSGDRQTFDCTSALVSTPGPACGVRQASALRQHNELYPKNDDQHPSELQKPELRRAVCIIDSLLKWLPSWLQQ
ncbi:hypothetical protein V3481_008269 [Fusarium oxysporum f. sp. vasinfectum]